VRDENNAKVRLAIFGTRADAIAKPNTKFSVSSSLHFSGARRVAVLSYGKTTRLTAQGDWRNPGFDGGFLPVQRSVTPNGFTAEWSIPFIARGVPSEGPADSIAKLQASPLGISFIEIADAYQSVSRSLKYVLLFVGLVFLCYFVFEVTTGRRVHPAQYVLVGIAQLIFYLLLLSLSERTGFDWGFVVAGASTVALLSVNAAWVFSSRLQGVRASIAFSMLYTLIYMLLRMEDNALLVGAIASFLSVTAVMYFTRKIDWYTPLAGTEESRQ
jgi:inner membrane protein